MIKFISWIFEAGVHVRVPVETAVIEHSDDITEAINHAIAGAPADHAFTAAAAAALAAAS